MEKVKVLLPNGEIDAELNGNSLIVDEAPGKELFADLSTVSIKGDNADITMSNCALIEIGSNDGKYWFAFTEISEAERMRADIDYLMLITE